MIRELDTVALTRDLDEYNLKHGGIGAVVHCYKDDAVFEVEFVTAEGKTITLFTLNRDDNRPIEGREVLHVRRLEQVAA
jgi:hypothetical protein